MKDEAYRNKKEAVQRILKQLKDDELDEEEAEELFQNGLEHISDARELLDVGSGTVDVED